MNEVVFIDYFGPTKCSFYNIAYYEHTWTFTAMTVIQKQLDLAHMFPYHLVWRSRMSLEKVNLVRNTREIRNNYPNAQFVWCISWESWHGNITLTHNVIMSSPLYQWLLTSLIQKYIKGLKNSTHWFDMAAVIIVVQHTCQFQNRYIQINAWHSR